MTRCKCSHLQDNHAGVPDTEGRRYCLLGGCPCMDYDHEKVTDVYSFLLAVRTAMRAEQPVKMLQLAAAYGSETPVSGDALARRKADLVIARR